MTVGILMLHCGLGIRNTNILQWILTKRGTYLVLKRIRNPIDFQVQRSRSPGQIFRRRDTPRFALPLFNFYSTYFMRVQYSFFILIIFSYFPFMGINLTLKFWYFQRNNFVIK
jgi:hypothetical protein